MPEQPPSIQTKSKPSKKLMSAGYAQASEESHLRSCSTVCFMIVGAPFAGALEIIVYAGAIMVLFVFVVMMLNLGQK
jgi:hypothetical protein